MQKFYDHFFAINIFIEIKDIGLDCFFAGIVDSWLGSDVGNAVVNFVFPVDFLETYTPFGGSSLKDGTCWLMVGTCMVRPSAFP